MLTKTLPALLLLTFPFLSVLSQSTVPEMKFGNAQPQDFTPAAYAVDSAADGVYLFDAGSSFYEGNNNGFLSVIFERHARIRLLHKNAFDLATVEIHLFGKDKEAQSLRSLEAVTCNLENGKVVKTVLDKNAVFKDQNPEYTTVRFTFPNIREGSIVEFKYRLIYSGYSYIPSWNYQGQYPRLYSQYQVNIPNLLDFVFVQQGDHPYYNHTAKEGYGSYNILFNDNPALRSEMYSWRGTTVTSTWSMKDVPAMKSEAYTTTVNNYLSRIEFQLAAIRIPDQPVKNVMHNWAEMSTELMKDESFGSALHLHNNWMEDELKIALAGSTDTLARLQKLYEYVRDHFTCTDDRAIYLSQPLKKVFQSKKGTVADINLLLTAMCINQGFEAYPVLLSTRDHGFALETYPILGKFNYLISKVKLNDQTYLLDASLPRLGFGRLDGNCYNGTGRTINPVEPLLVSLSPDSLQETSVTTAFLVNENGHISGSYTCTPGYYASLRLRPRLGKDRQEEFFKDFRKQFAYEVALSNTSVDSLQLLDKPVSYKCDLQFDFNNEPLVYFNPLMSERLTENPFKSSERLYPVEMPSRTSQTYLLNMEIPKGYKVDELPKSTRVNLNEDEGFFEYMIVATKETVQLRCRLILYKANYKREDYQLLRDFFTYVVKKESEQIVFKKIDQ